MLLAMRDNSFVVATALTKTEAVQIVAFGMLFLGDSATPALLLAVTLATLGVFVLAFPRVSIFIRRDARSNWRAAGYGLASAAAFGLSTVAFRAGVLALGGASFVVAAAEELALALTLQTLVILCWLAFADRAELAAIAREWRSSLSAGFLGAFATQFWFLALALVERGAGAHAGPRGGRSSRNSSPIASSRNGPADAKPWGFSSFWRAWRWRSMGDDAEALDERTAETAQELGRGLTIELIVSHFNSHGKITLRGSNSSRNGGKSHGTFQSCSRSCENLPPIDPCSGDFSKRGGGRFR